MNVPPPDLCLVSAHAVPVKYAVVNNWYWRWICVTIALAQKCYVYQFYVIPTDNRYPNQWNDLLDELPLPLMLASNLVKTAGTTLVSVFVYCEHISENNCRTVSKCKKNIWASLIIWTIRHICILLQITTIILTSLFVWGVWDSLPASLYVDRSLSLSVLKECIFC